MTQRQFNGLRVGSRVRVKSNLITNTRYSDINFSDEMVNFRGKIMIVIRTSFDTHIKYVIGSINSDTSYYYKYSKDMVDMVFKYGR